MPFTAPEIAPQGVPNVRFTATANESTFGGGPGLEQADQQVQKISSDVGQIATLEKIRADQTAVQEATDKLAQIHTKILYDPQTGVIASRGVNAIPAQTKGWADYKKATNDIAGTLNGPEQKGAFTKAALAMGDTFNRQAMSHVDQQLKEHDTSTFKSLVKNLTDQGAMSYGDALHRSLLLNTLDDNATQYARRNGLGPDETEAMKSDINSNFHEQVISRMLADKNDITAQKYFDENKDNITDSKTRDQIEKQLEVGSYRGESQRKADTIWKDSDGNLSDALDNARDIKDPELRDKTIDRLKERDRENKEARVSDQENAFYDASQQLGQAKQQGKINGDSSLEDFVPPSTWIRMTPSQQESLKRLYLGGDENSAQVWTSWNLMSPTDKAGMSKADFQTNVLSHLDKKNRDTAMHQYNDALGNKTMALSDHEQATLIEKSAQESGIINGLRPGKSAKKLTGDAARDYGAFQDNIQSAVSDYERTVLGGRRRASLEETQKIVDQQILKGLEDKGPSLFTSAGRSLGLSTTPTVTYDKIPEDAREHLLSFARQSGKKISQEKMERAYVAYQNKDRKGVAKAFE